MVSAGGPNHELSSLNLETGIVETIFRCSNPESDKKITSSDLPIIPTFIRENNFADNKLITQRRETNLQSFNRHLHAVHNHQEFLRIVSHNQQKLIRNVD
jgi:hypothetical protein